MKTNGQQNLGGATVVNVEQTVLKPSNTIRCEFIYYQNCFFYFGHIV